MIFNRMNKVKIAILFFLLTSTQVNAMGLFDFLKINVLTELNGTVTLDGVPVSGVKVVLTARTVFNDETVEVVSNTDDKGAFHFDEINASSINTLLPSAKMINQKITFFYQDKEYLAWDLVKNNYEKNGELNNLSAMNERSQFIPMVLTCDLNNELTTRKAGTHDHVALTGICRWKNE